MTPEERAQAALDMAYDDTINKTLRDLIATAIVEAVAAEREACAKVAEAEMIERPCPDDNLARFYNEACGDIATAIRSRSKEGEEG